MIVLSKKGELLGYDCEPSVRISCGKLELYIWGGVPFLYLDHPFSKTDIYENLVSGLEDIVPYMAGNCLFFLLKDGVVQEIASDYYAHARFYYTDYRGKYYISDDWRVLPHETDKLNLFQLMYFLNWDLCFDGETYFEDLKYFSPSYKYVIPNGNKKVYMRLKDLHTENFHQAIKDTLKAINDSGKKISIMLSGGMDSAEVALATKELDIDARMMCSKINDLENYDNIQDCVGAKVLAEELSLDLEYVNCNIKSFLDGWNGKLSKYVAFAYKDGRLWQSLARADHEFGKEEILINGNNGDYMHNFCYTKNCVVRELSYGYEYFKDMREVTTNCNLEKVFKDCDLSGTSVENIWKKYNDDSFDKEKFLAWCISIGNYFPGYKGLAVSSAATEMGKRIYDDGIHLRMKQLIDLVDSEKINMRALLLEGILLGEMDGENCRAITGACYANNRECFLIHGSPLVLDAARKMVFDENDINTPKRSTKEILYKSMDFERVEREKDAVVPDKMLSSSEMWGKVYDILSTEFDFEGCSSLSKEVLKECGCFNISEIEKLAEQDIGIKLRLAWIGYIYSIYC